MNVWRMKLRAGNGGEDMWPACRGRGIASFTHGPIYETDLSNLEKSDIDPAVKGSARPSIWWFGWEIKGGDVIYVGDSKTRSVIGRGTVLGGLGKRAYRYNAGNAITEPGSPKIAWRHEVPVDWDAEFEEFTYKDPAPQNSVFPIRIQELKKRDGQREQFSTDEADGADALLSELTHQRETPAAKKTIMGLHRHLSNHFRMWLERSYSLKAVQEKNRIDLIFSHSSKGHLAEFKICYAADTRHAIREALGQLFEYNHYPSYNAADFWWLVLDCEPSNSDREFISTLIERYKVPITLAWPSGEHFRAFPSSPFDWRS